MNDFFAPAIPADKVLSDKFRVHLVKGDGMSPALRSNWDYVLLAPVDHYCGEGIYLIDIGGGEALYRIQTIMGGKLMMKLDNPAYPGNHILTREKFPEIVIAFVVADIKVRDERFLRDCGGWGRNTRDIRPVDNGDSGENRT